MKNDDKILELKSQIADKKKDLIKKNKIFNPITNCIIDFEGIRSNLNTLTKEQLVLLLIKLNSYRLSGIKLIDDFPGLFNVILINGYDIDVWIQDIINKLKIINYKEVINYKEEENELKIMESKLYELLSDEKKTELEISKIENMLSE